MTNSTRFLLVLLVPGIVGLVPRGDGPAGDPERDLPELGIGVGQAHPDASLPDLDGTQRRLSDLRGKRLLLFHFASW